MYPVKIDTNSKKRSSVKPVQFFLLGFVKVKNTHTQTRMYALKNEKAKEEEEERKEKKCNFNLKFIPLFFFFLAC